MNYYIKCDLEQLTLQRGQVNRQVSTYSAHHSCALSSYASLTKTSLEVRKRQEKDT